VSMIANQDSSRDAPPRPHRPPSGFWQVATHIGLGILGLALITLTATRLNLQPGAISLLYLIVVVFISLRGGLGSSVAVSLIAVLCLNYFFLSQSSSSGGRNPLDLVATVAFLFTSWVITAMVTRVHRLTEAQMVLRFEERLSERSRIARELHDTLLQSFQALMLHFQVANELLPPGKAKEALERALDRGDRAIVESREAIQNLRSSSATASELAQSIAALGEELGEVPDGVTRPATFRVAVEGTPRDLHPILRDDVYRIVREALRNAFQHAQANRIETDITYGDGFLRLRVRDDGKGIDPRHLAAGRDGHWGVQGMRERAQQIGGKLDMWSEAGAGTEVELRIPGHIAYSASPRQDHFKLFGKGGKG
jgi:signal transduction histidine kinase